MMMPTRMIKNIKAATAIPTMVDAEIFSGEGLTTVGLIDRLCLTELQV